MSTIKTAAEAMQRLEELKLEITGKKPDPTAEARKQSAAYSTAFWDTMHTGMPTNALKAGSDGAVAIWCRILTKKNWWKL